MNLQVTNMTLQGFLINFNLDNNELIAEFRNYNYHYNYYNNYNDNYNYTHNYYYNYHYNIVGLVDAENTPKILFTIRESDANGSSHFLTWIKIFNDRVAEVAAVNDCQIQDWQNYYEVKTI